MSHRIRSTSSRGTNVRASMTTASAVVMVIPRAWRVGSIEPTEDVNWMRVQIGDVIGYVATAYVEYERRAVGVPPSDGGRDELVDVHLTFRIPASSREDVVMVLRRVADAIFYAGES